MTEFNLLFKALGIVEKDLKTKILNVAVLQTIPKNKLIVEQGKYIKWLAIVISGKVRVWQANDERQILLHYVNPIQTCALSLSATFKDCLSCINAKTVEETTIIKIPVRYIKSWSFQYQSWHNFTTQSFINSYDELLQAYSSLAFYKIDKRLLSYLQSLAQKNNSPYILLSHSELAKELGTTREVISKILKQFERADIVKLSFKQIELNKF